MSNSTTKPPDEDWVRHWHRRSMTDEELIDALRIAYTVNDRILNGGIRKLPPYLTGKSKVAILADACIELTIRRQVDLQRLVKSGDEG